MTRSERLRGKTTIATLMNKGRWRSTLHLRCCCLSSNGLEINRIMVSVPKRHFKRAVKRNLLKRRMREAYRLNKELAGAGGHDMLFVYNSPQIVPYADICEELKSLLSSIAAER